MADITLKTRIQLRNDTQENWEKVKDTLIPLAGEMCITNDGPDKGRFKIGDGTSTWGQLPYSGTGADFTVDAKNVMFSQDMIFTEKFGKYTPSGGKVTVPSNDKSLLATLLDAFAEDQNPNVTQPAVSISSGDFKAYEVGTKVTPKYNATLSAGNYQFGPATGVTAKTWSVKDNAGQVTTLNTASGSFPELTVEDGTSYSITAIATYDAGAMPKTALGSDYPAGQIKAGSKQATKGTISGYRNGFYGTFTGAKELNSANIRTLTKTNKAVTAGTVLNVSIPVGAMRVVFAYPATIREVNSVLDVNGLNAEIKSAFKSITVSVLGANNHDGIDYRVYYLDYAKPNDAQNTYKVTI